jgi:hypothetical protein
MVLTVSRLVSIIRAIRMMRGSVAAPSIADPISLHPPDHNNHAGGLE